MKKPSAHQLQPQLQRQKLPLMSLFGKYHFLSLKDEGGLKSEGQVKFQRGVLIDRFPIIASFIEEKDGEAVGEQNLHSSFDLQFWRWCS